MLNSYFTALFSDAELLTQILYSTEEISTRIETDLYSIGFIRKHTFVGRQKSIAFTFGQQNAVSTQGNEDTYFNIAAESYLPVATFR